MRLSLGSIRIGLGWRSHVGLVCLWREPLQRAASCYTLHLLIRPDAWAWGYDGTDEPWLEQWGAGPFALLVRG